MQDASKTYKASELVAALEALIDSHGDLPVLLNDPDTGWLLDVGVAFAPYDKSEPDYPARIEINANYHGAPTGAKPTIQ